VFGVDAGELESKADPPPPAGDLQSEIDAFTTEGACIEARAKVDPLLGDVLEAIGYETLLRDACVLLEAARSRDPKRCAAIDASIFRERCEATVAEVAANPDACPWAIASRPRDGRDPACVAIALRDRRLCASVRQTKARATCEAVAGHEPKACARVAGLASQAQCLRTATRWSRAIVSPSRALPPLSPSETLTFAQTPADGVAAPPGITDLGPDVGRGLVLLQSHDGIHFDVGPAKDDEVDLIGPQPHAGASLSLEFVVPSSNGPPAALFVASAELRVPGHLPVFWKTGHGSLQAKVEKFEPVRGGRVNLTVDGDMKDASGSWHVHADLRAFVRDTVRSGDLVPVTAP
jgi:hypothetical protein